MILDFFNIVANLKKIPRQGWIEKAGIHNPESVADHTYSLTVMAMILSELNHLDSGKTIKMSLLHDLAESITGDITPDTMPKNEKTVLENDAMNKILKKLPDNLQEKYQTIWREYQDNQTKEAQLVHDLDKVEMALQAKIYSKDMSSTALKQFLNSAVSSVNSYEIKKILAKILDQ